MKHGIAINHQHSHMLYSQGTQGYRVHLVNWSMSLYSVCQNREWDNTILLPIHCVDLVLVLYFRILSHTICGCVIKEPSIFVTKAIIFFVWYFAEWWLGIMWQLSAKVSRNPYHLPLHPLLAPSLVPKVCRFLKYQTQALIAFDRLWLLITPRHRQTCYNSVRSLSTHKSSALPHIILFPSSH